jgi:josephin
MYCGIHCVNNMLQRKECTKENFDSWCESIHDEEVKQGLATRSLFGVNPHKSVFGVGNFDVNVLVKAFEQSGCQMEWTDRRKPLDEIVNQSLLQNADCIGIVCNVKQDGIFSSIMGSRHWITIKKVNSDEEKISDSKPKIYNLDSKLPGPQELSSDELIALLTSWVANSDANIFLVTHTPKPSTEQ